MNQITFFNHPIQAEIRPRYEASLGVQSIAQASTDELEQALKGWTRLLREREKDTQRLLSVLKESLHDIEKSKEKGIWHP